MTRASHTVGSRPSHFLFLFIRLTARSTHSQDVRSKSQHACSAPTPPPAPDRSRTHFPRPAFLPRPYPAQEVVLKKRLLEHRGHLLQAQHVAKVGELLLSQGPGARGVETVKQLLESGLMLVLPRLIHPIAHGAHLCGTETRGVAAAPGAGRPGPRWRLAGDKTVGLSRRQPAPMGTPVRATSHRSGRAGYRYQNEGVSSPASSWGVWPVSNSRLKAVLHQLTWPWTYRR